MRLADIKKAPQLRSPMLNFLNQGNKSQGTVILKSLLWLFLVLEIFDLIV